MNYIPHTDSDRQKMLDAIGASSMEEFFEVVPSHLRYPPLKLPDPLSEMEIIRELEAMSERNASLNRHTCFLGAGAYRHFVPSLVGHVISRNEFYTAYTPYQPEISQGTLQAIFEYQSMICALTGMEVANASHYDGATSMAEAVIMALNVARHMRRKVILSPTIHPEYRATVRTYLRGMGITLAGEQGGLAGAEPEHLKGLLDENTACLIVQNPDFLGRLESPQALSKLSEDVHAAGALFIVAADPISLGLFKPPGEYGADVVVGEGQPLGNPLNFGGPYLGIFACREKYMHKMAGRLIGQTADRQGRRGFVMVLGAREQHIRREKATSNICTNQSLCALGAAVYLATMGKQGLRKVAELCYHKAHYAAEKISSLPGYKLVSKKPFFKEFAIRCPRPVREINKSLLEQGIIGGYDLSRDWPELENCMLLCVTEMNTKEEIDRLVEALATLPQVRKPAGGSGQRR
ncbi:MAG: aminomethyl-transferring glycine dehydrogenase subunit GcvPA [Anaerolineae bacterium]